MTLKTRKHLRSLALSVMAVAAFGAAVAFIALWISGYIRRDVFTLRLSATQWFWMESVRGGIQFVRETNTSPEMFNSGWQVLQPADALPSNTRLGFGFVSTTFPIWDGEQSRTIHITAVALHPLALIIPFSGIAALAARRWWIRRLRNVRGLCARCGYDLRSSPDRCPECGVAVEGRGHRT